VCVSFLAQMFKNFVKDLLKSGAPRFGVVDVFKTFADGHVEQRPALLRYSPDTAGVKAKMVYSQAEGNFKGKVTTTSRNPPVRAARACAYLY
jgi:hypothetical protein